MDKDPLLQWFLDRFGAIGVYVLLAIIVWSIIWKGLALWRAAKLGSKTWFIVILILNTAGILEILYLFWLGKKGRGSDPSLPAA